MKISDAIHDGLTRAYLLMVLSLGLHVIDEAITGFLGFYNPLVLKLREQFEFIPFPVFPFWLWILGLSLLVMVLFLLTSLINRRNKIYVFIIRVFSFIMILNGLGHILGSIYLSRILPGFYSSPLLLAFSIYLLIILSGKSESKSRLSDSI
jgi:hypothetical protein